MQEANISTNEPVRLVMSYGERLQKALAASGRERKELAQACGCTVQNLGMVITSAGGKERTLGVQAHAKAARYLGVDSYWLATGLGKMRSDGAGPGSGLSDDALEIAEYFDKLTHKVARTRAYVASMAVILRELEPAAPPQPVDQSTLGQDAPESSKTPPA